MLWSPSKDFVDRSNLRRYTRWLAENKKLYFTEYHELWKWSVANPEDFWESIWQHFNVIHDGDYNAVLDKQNTFRVSWFEGTNLNYAEQIFSKSNEQYPAIIFKSESGNIKEISWKELLSQVASLQHYLKISNVSKGDCIVGYMPCIPEATIGLLATVSLGAIWSSCSPDFGTAAVIDRFSQINPKILIAVDRYTYGGKSFDKTDVVQELIKDLPTVERIILVSEKSTLHPGEKPITSWRDVIQDSNRTLEIIRVPFSHPLWILYSSGTTGLPKAFVHSHGGILLEHLKYGAFHNDFKPGERCFWYTTTGWMMWNYIHGSLLVGGTMVLYDGSEHGWHG